MKFTRGITTSEFVKSIPLYVIAAIALWKGYDATQMTGAVSTFAENIDKIASAMVAIAAIGGITLDNRKYIDARKELKKHFTERVAEVEKHRIDKLAELKTKERTMSAARKAVMRKQ